MYLEVKDLKKSYGEGGGYVQVLKGRELVITIETMDDIALEKALFDAKTSYFENIFSIKPVIKEKRVYG